MEQITFTEFISWLIFGGGSILASSFILERLAWFKALASEAKKWVAYGTASGLSIGSYVLITYAPTFVNAAEPYFMILASIFVAIFLTNSFHKEDKEKPEAG